MSWANFCHSCWRCSKCNEALIWHEVSAKHNLWLQRLVWVICLPQSCSSVSSTLAVYAASRMERVSTSDVCSMSWGLWWVTSVHLLIVFAANLFVVNTLFPTCFGFGGQICFYTVAASILGSNIPLALQATCYRVCLSHYQYVILNQPPTAYLFLDRSPFSSMLFYTNLSITLYLFIFFSPCELWLSMYPTCVKFVLFLNEIIDSCVQIFCETNHINQTVVHGNRFRRLRCENAWWFHLTMKCCNHYQHKCAVPIFCGGPQNTWTEIQEQQLDKL